MTDKHKKNEDEEIAIDFSKVKNWFKKDKKSHSKPASHEHHDHSSHEHAHKHEEHPAAHSAEHHKELHTKESSEDSAFDYKDTVAFFKKYGTWFLILIPIILTIYLRLQPMYLPMTDDWAQNSVYGYYQNQVAQQINAQYPNLPEANKKALVDSEFQRLLGENRDMIDQQIAQASQQYKERLMYESGDSKYVYLGDIDSYYWLREARRVIEKGVNCDEIDYENNYCYEDTYTQAPLKNSIKLGSQTINPYTRSIIYTYKTLKLFNPDITIMQASFYVPLIYAIISAILAFLIGRLISGNLAGLITSVFIAVNPVFLSRTLGSDNDPQGMLYPLMIVLFFLYTFKVDDIKKRIIFGALTGLSIGIFAWAWQGWWFMFGFIMGSLVIYTGYFVVKQLVQKKKLVEIVKNKELKRLVTTLLLIFVSSAFFTTIINSFSTFMNAITSPFWFMRTKEAALESFWPNVLVTVAEFNPGSISSIIAQMGGKLIFFLGMLGVLFVLTSKDKIKTQQKYLLGIGAVIYLFLTSQYGTTLGPKTYMFLVALPVIIGMVILLKSKEDVDMKLAILLIIWFVATTYAALKGVRFTLLMVSAFGVAFGITISALYRIISRWISSELKINELLTKTVVAILLLLVLIAPVKAGYNTATNFLPSVNDAWYNSLTGIRDNSEPDAIINSWWDFGHWFKYIADRRVTLDGSSQGGPPLHWLGKLMVTDDEQQSVGILRMLDCGSNTAFDELNEILNDTPKSIELLDNIVKLDKKSAGEALLDADLTKEQATVVLKYTHCDPPEDFFITSEDMVGKAGVWGHFGSWDFNRAEMFNKVKGTDSATGKEILSDNRYNLTPEQIDQYYYEIQTQSDSEWITSWPGYMSGVQPCQMPGETGFMICNLVLSNGQQIPAGINLTNMDVLINAQGNPKPYSLVYVTENGTEEKKFEENIMGFSIVLIPRGADGYATLITHPALANSIFTRLFYLEGHGLEHFDKFSDQQGITGGRIIVWKVDWEGIDANEVYKAVSSEDVETLSDEKVDKTSDIEKDASETKKEDALVEMSGETSTEASEDAKKISGQAGLDADSIEIGLETE